MFPMPRIIYAMATDGVIFKIFGKVLPKLKTPFVASLFGGIMASIMGCIFDLNGLVEMLSIGTLMAYTLVAVCVLLLRYVFFLKDFHKSDTNQTYDHRICWILDLGLGSNPNENLKTTLI